MKKPALIILFVLVIAASFSVYLYAQDFYVISAPKEVMPQNYAPVPKTGVTTSWTTGDDGDLEKGIAWPNPRFTKNNDGTVTDNLTGLVWFQDAYVTVGLVYWNDAINFCNGLESGESGLSDGSSPGDWRMPNFFEMMSLLDMGHYDPAVCDTAGTAKWSAGDPFDNIQFEYYWTSTHSAENADSVFLVNMGHGYVDTSTKGGTYRIWPVRDAK